MITLKDIEYNTFIWDRDYFKAIQEFLWAFKWDIDEILWSHSLMYKEWTDIYQSDKRVIDKDLWVKYWNAYTFRVEFKCEWILAEFFWDTWSYMLLPKMHNTSNVVKINSETILRYFIKDLVKEWYLTDKYYLIIWPLLKTFKLWYNTRLKKIWFLEETLWWKKLYRTSWQKILWTLSTTTHVTLEEVLDKEISLWYINKDIWDPNRKFAYTHSLRKHCEYFLLQWTRRVIMTWNKINVVAASKWSGKSFYAAELCANELLKAGKWFWWRKKRQIKYFVPDLQNVWSSVMDYMEWFLWWLTRTKVNWESVIKINRSKYEITCSLTWTTFRMVSLHWFGTWSTWEWLACDFAVIDEAAYVPDEFWTLFSQRALMETEHMLIITTISEKTPRDHWFYRLLIEWELWSPLISSHRVDILQKRELYELDYINNTPLVTEEDHIEKDRKLDEIMDFTMENLRKWWIKEFYARAFCVILDEKNVFNVTWNVIQDIPYMWNEKDYYILALDFWWNSDPAWVAMINITKKIVCYTEEIKWMPYLQQLNIAKTMKLKLKNLTVIWDATTIGKVIMQEDRLWEEIVDYWIQFTGNWDWSYNNKGFYVVSKTHLVETTALCLDKWILGIGQSNEKLINQMKNFVKISWTKSLINKYQWKGNMHDDLVDALMMCCFTIVNIFSLTDSTLWENYWVEFDKQDIYLYNENNYSQEEYYSTWNLY